MFKGKNVVLGITGGIAAYKATAIINTLVIDLHANVDVIMTESAEKFITELTIRTLSRNLVNRDMWAEPRTWEVEHISLAKKADIFLIAPATANIIGKVANGIADDLLTTTVMATTAPVVFAPAMNEKMYANPIVQDNMKKLKGYGYQFVEPHAGHARMRRYGQWRTRDDEGDHRLHSAADAQGKAQMTGAATFAGRE